MRLKFATRLVDRRKCGGGDDQDPRPLYSHEGERGGRPGPMI